MIELIEQAVSVIRQGGVIAYPTEHCFGLGCDPTNQQAVQRILEIKNRSVEQGLILIASKQSQVQIYADIDASPLKADILASWPGPVTWTLPVRSSTPIWISGKHQSIAMRVTSHHFSSQLCEEFGGAIVSTSANRHGQTALLSNDQVSNQMQNEIDYIVDAPVGGANQPSQIKDSMTGAVLR